MNLTSRLFGTYPREVGNPSRSIIFSDYQLNSFINKNSGANPCFITVYRLNTFICEIDKLFFDFDGDCLGDFATFYETLLDQKIPVISVITGKKGFHAHVLLKREIYPYPDSKELLYNAAIYLLMRAFDKIPETVDSSVLGDTRRFCRLPGTMREDKKNYCSYMPSYWNQLQNSENYNMTKNPHDYGLWSLNPRAIKELTLYDFPTVYETPTTKSDTREHTANINSEFLKSILRPCLYRHLTRYEEPLHDARVAATVDLLQFYDETTIFNIYSKLGWIDFKIKRTTKQINKCKNYQPYSCRKLREKGIPRKCCIE